MTKRLPRTLLMPSQFGSAGPDGPGGPPLCGCCREELDLHQPNMERPDEMLGTCPACGAWHFVATIHDDSSVIVAPLSVDQLREELTTPILPSSAGVG